MVAENTLICSEDRLIIISDATWIDIADIDGHITRDSFRVLLVGLWLLLLFLLPS
jgi:hypothetical protein